MKRRNATRNALLMSVLSMLLCVSMLVGTTFAWFTDSVTSGINKIQSGNLDLEVYYAYPSDVVDGDIPENAWKPVKADEAVFNEAALWVPGYTEVVFFKIDNVGSLAFQYQFKVDILNEVIGKTKDGADIRLSDYIQAYAAANADWAYKQLLFTDRNSVVNPPYAPDEFSDTLYVTANMDLCRADDPYTNALSLDHWQWLEPDETYYVTMALWMPTTVGNEANHNGTDIPSIDLGINVLATQYDWEEERDSFDHEYDEDAEYPVMNVADLKDALKNKENVTLGDDVKIDTNEDSESNSYGKTGLNITDGQIFDGNGNTLSVKGANGTWDSAVNITSGTIKNLTIDSGFRGVFVNHNGTAGHVTLQNVIIDGPTYTISCDQGTGNGLTAIDSTFNGWTSYAATIGNVEFEGCSFGAGAGYAFCRPYAPTSFVNCNFAAGYQMDARAAVTFENCTIGGVALTAENLATLVTGNTANATVK